MKILSVIGARPQFVKLAPFSRVLREVHEEVIVHTGQHYDRAMSGAFFDQLGIPEPDHHLDIRSGSHGVQTGRMLAGIEGVIQDEGPDAVVVFGDTNTTLAGALAAAKLHVPVVHIEAGLRSFNRTMPEEVNRVLTDHASDILFVPTDAAMRNLEREGLAARAHLVGDIMVDSILERVAVAERASTVLDELGLADGDYFLLTLHRPYNVDDPARLAAIVHAVGDLGSPVVFPVHPRTRQVMANHGIEVPESVRAINPQGFLDFVRLEAGAQKVLTDSGGVQKEAYILGKPCITLRPETEWVETVDAGWNVLADPEEPGFAEMVAGFSPNGARPDVFGRDVAMQMVERLDVLRCYLRLPRPQSGLG